MSVFIDTGVFYAHHDADASNNQDATAAFEAVFDGEYGQPYTSEYILDESITLTKQRTDSFDAATTIANRILGNNSYSDVIEMLFVEPDELTASLSTFRTYSDHDLSFTDATTIQLCEQHGIDAVLSFDSDFDGILNRVPPQK